MAAYDLHKRAAAVVRDAGNELVGRTRLQKIVYLSQLAGFAEDFEFEYRHYGPFSENLSEAMQIACGLRLVAEKEKSTNWGGWYSTYSIDEGAVSDLPEDSERAKFLQHAKTVGAIELELAATAAFLYDKEDIGKDGNKDAPWAETARRKPEKATPERLAGAKDAYRKLMDMRLPQPLPPIV
jgi:uncharacterized protein